MIGEGTPLTLCTQCHCAQEGVNRQSCGHPDCPSHLVQVSPTARLLSLTLLCCPWEWLLGLSSDLQKTLLYSLACWLLRSRGELN